MQVYIWRDSVYTNKFRVIFLKLQYYREVDPLLLVLGSVLLGGLKMCFLSWVGSKFTLHCRVGSK